MRRAKVVLVVAVLLVVCVAGEVESETGRVLEMGVGKSVALGDAGQASISTASAMHYNPAGLSFMKPGYYQMSYQRQMEGVSFGNVDMGTRLGGVALGGGLRYLDYGSEERLVYEPGAGLEGELRSAGRFESSDVVMSGGAAGRWGSFGYGGVLRMVRMKIDNEKAQGYAMDVGVQKRFGGNQMPAIAMGLVLKNAGSGLKFVEESEALPMLVRGGMSGYYGMSGGYVGLGVHGDVEMKLAGDGGMSYLGGVELKVLEGVRLMAGYDGRNDAGSPLTFGLGVVLLEEWNLPGHYMKLDYGMTDRGELGAVHQFTVSVYPY